MLERLEFTSHHTDSLTWLLFSKTLNLFLTSTKCLSCHTLTIVVVFGGFFGGEGVAHKHNISQPFCSYRAQISQKSITAKLNIIPGWKAVSFWFYSFKAAAPVTTPSSHVNVLITPAIHFYINDASKTSEGYRKNKIYTGC